jgi:hypothetical protein
LVDFGANDVLNTKFTNAAIFRRSKERPSFIAKKLKERN